MQCQGRRQRAWVFGKPPLTVLVPEIWAFQASSLEDMSEHQVPRLERWLSGLEHVLLLQRT